MGIEIVCIMVRGKRVMGEKLLLAIALTFAISLFSNASLSSSTQASRNMTWEGLPIFHLILKH